MAKKRKPSVQTQNQQAMHPIQHARVEKYCWYPVCPPQRPRMPCYGIYCPRIFIKRKPQQPQPNDPAKSASE